MMSVLSEKLVDALSAVLHNALEFYECAGVDEDPDHARHGDYQHARWTLCRLEEESRDFS